MLPITETSLLHGTTAVRGGGGMISISLSGLSPVGVSGGGFFYVMEVNSEECCRLGEGIGMKYWIDTL